MYICTQIQCNPNFLFISQSPLLRKVVIITAYLPMAIYYMMKATLNIKVECFLHNHPHQRYTRGILYTVTTLNNPLHYIYTINMKMQGLYASRKGMLLFTLMSYESLNKALILCPFFQYSLFPCLWWRYNFLRQEHFKHSVLGCIPWLWFTSLHMHQPNNSGTLLGNGLGIQSVSWSYFGEGIDIRAVLYPNNFSIPNLCILINSCTSVFEDPNLCTVRIRGLLTDFITKSKDSWESTKNFKEKYREIHVITKLFFFFQLFTFQRCYKQFTKRLQSTLGCWDRNQDLSR